MRRIVAAERDVMRAYVLTEMGPDFAGTERPEPGPDGVLVKVRAAAMNRADLGIASGRAHGSMGGPGTKLGLEWAGEVVAVGANVSHVGPGDSVMCSGQGGFAEYAVTDRGRVLPFDSSKLPFESAAALPSALLTMHDAVVTKGRVAAGQSVVIQGASSGVGLMGLQIARLKGATPVIGTSTRAENRARLAAFGADLALDSSDTEWPAAVMEATGGHGADLIVDQVSGAQGELNLKAAAVRGTIVNVGRLGGRTGTFDFDLHALKQIRYIGVTFRTRTLDEVRAISAAMLADIGPAVADGTLSLPVDHVFDFGDVSEAYARMKANAHFGKIVVAVDRG